MTGQDRPGIAGLSWSAFGGMRTPTAWGGAAAELQTPPSTFREAMQADEIQAKAERAFAARRTMEQEKQYDAAHQAMSAEAWMQEALKAKPDPRTGQLHCPMCQRPAVDYHTLAQHMKDKHDFEPPARGPVTVSLSDLLQATSRFPNTARNVAPVPRLTSKQMQGVKGLLKAYPTQHALADALRKQKPLLANKKRLSRLKRIILKERGEKALGDATEAATKAARAVDMAQRQRYSIQEQLKAAIEKVTLDNTGQPLLDAASLTNLQVVEAAANEAEQNVLEAERKLQTAQAKLSKLQKEREAQEAAKALAAEEASASQQLPESSGEASASAEGPAEAPSSSASRTTAPEAAVPSTADEGRAAYVSERPFVSLSDLQDFAGVARAQREWQPASQGMEGKVSEEAGAAAEETDEGYESSVDGLDDFEDILASWMHSSRGLLADNGAAAQAGWLHSQAMDEQGRSAAKAAREEQPPAAATGWRPELARLSHLAASEEQPPAPAASAAPPAWVRSKGRGEFANFAAVAASGKQPMPAATESTESDSEDDDDEMAPGDWDDILAVWMTAVGLPNLESGRPAASGTSESSDEDEDLPGVMAKQSSPKGASFPGTAATSPAAGAQPQQPAAQPSSQLPAPQALPASEATAQQEAPLIQAPPAAARVVAPQAPTPIQAPAPRQAPSQESLVQHLQQLPAPGQVQGQAPSQAPGVGSAAGQLPQLPPPLNGAAISQFLASYHTGQTSTAGRPVLAMGPLLNTHASDALPLLGAGFPGSRPQTANASTSRGADGIAMAQQATSSGVSPFTAPSASVPVASQNASTARSLQGSSSSAQLPPGSTPFTAAMSQMAATTRSLQSHWQAMLKQQGQAVPVEELLDRRMFGNASNETSLMASPVESGLSTPQLSMAVDRTATRSSSAGGSRGEGMPEQARQQAPVQPSLPKEPPRSAQPGPTVPSVTIDEARQRALDAILKKHELPVNMQPGSAGPQLPQMPVPPGAGGLPNLSEQELLMLQQAPQTSQTHDAISFWLDWQAQQERQQADAQALQQGLQSMSLHQQTPHGMQGMDAFALRSYGSAHALDPNQGMKPLMEAGWPGMAADSGGLGSHDFTCEVCGITCCGLVNFEQHCSSKKHLRKAAAAAGALTGASVVASDSTDTERNTTYVGLQAQCRSYCKQIISTELNRAVLELLQQLLFWQERAKSASPYNLAKRKRLVSGLREVAKAVRLRKACTVVVAPNIEHIEAEGGLDDLLTSILTQAEASNIPIVFALSRKKLGQMFGCRKKMSAIAILDYSGAEAVYHHMESLAEEGRQTWIAHHGSGSGSTASRPSSQPQSVAQGPPAQQQPPPAQAPSLSSEQARPSPRPLSAGSVPMDLAQAQAQAQAQARRPPMQGMPPPPQQQQQQQARGMPQQYGGMPKPGFAPQHQRPYGGPPQPPQHRAGQYGPLGQNLPPRYQMPQDPRFQNPGGQYRLQQPLPQIQMQQQQLLQRQRAMQQQQQQQAMLPNEAMGLHPGLQRPQHERWTSYEQHMALLQLQQQQQQQQQQSSYDASEAAQLAELQQGVPLTSLGSLSNDALISLQALGGQSFEQGQLAALYSQQQLSQQLQLSSLSDSEQAYGLQDPGMQTAWQNPDLGQGHWMP